MKWFQDCSRLISEQQRPMTWISPSGFPVHQEYHKMHEKKISTWIGGTATHITFYDTKDEISSRKQSNGVSPNFVHALDASALHKTVIRCNQQKDIYDFSMVHDSYGTHSTNCQAMSDVIRNVFYEMFSVDLLADWQHQLETDNPDITFPAPPAYGDADLSKLKDSTYFFS
jgi:DNA-directed RNA polymerase